MLNIFLGFLLFTFLLLKRSDQSHSIIHPLAAISASFSTRCCITKVTVIHQTFFYILAKPRNTRRGGHLGSSIKGLKRTSFKEKEGREERKLWGFLGAVINKFKAYSSPPAFFATFVYSDALLRATSMASLLLLFCTKFQITRVTPTYLSTVRVRQHSETEIEKVFLIKLDWMRKILPVSFESFQHVVFRPFISSFPLSVRLLSRFGNVICVGKCVFVGRRDLGFLSSSSYISAWRLRWFWVVFQKEKEKLICHPKIQMLKRRWKSKSTLYYYSCSCLLIGSLYLNPLLFLYISLPSRHIPIRRRP